MIIKSYEIEKIKLTNSNIHLIYGNNEGIKEDIINEIYLKKFDGDLLKYEEQEILNQKDEFVSGLFTKSLFENKKLIIISRVTDKFIDILSDILEKELLDTKIIIKSSSLEKKSKIRSVFEKGKNILCTPVYEDDSRSLNYVIQTYLRENKLSISQEIKNLLIDRSNGDRINLINELYKLKNLSLTRKTLTSEDAKKLSNLTENYSVFELSDNYLAKNSKKVSNILNENNYSPEDCMLIIRTMLNKSKRLLKIKTSMDEDVNLDQVISNFKPPIFWKEKDIVKKQAQSWSTSEVKELIFKINGLEALVKKNSANSVIFVSNFISNY